RYKKFDAEKTYLSEFFNGQKKNMNYIYDFGDDWIHTITVLKKPNEEVLYPKCIKGENAAPIEDCGGVWGFYELLEIISKKRKTAEDKEMLEWVRIPKGKSYEDIYAFDINEVNQRLIDAFR
ncbi:MAG TPA: plasmid pRiA4b ORF-3 family protein, partial [Flavobacterium sp.]|nr:plasmid pRiA4b ORF-3 family protein [Flavobacterium sp.]